jgi:hypothetical protein
MPGDETMDAIRLRDDDPAGIPIMWMWSVGCVFGVGTLETGGISVYHFGARLRFFFSEHVFVLVLLLGWILFSFGLRYPLPSTGGWAYIFSAGLV